MAPPAGITAFRVRITEPELLDNYADFLRGIKRGGRPIVGGKRKSKLRGEAAQEAIETQLGRFVQAKVRGGNVRLLPDFEINAKEISAPLAAALGLEDVTEIEAKATRGGKEGATIGQASPFAMEGGQQVGSLSLTEAIKTAARQADPGIDIQNKEGVLRAARTALGGAPKFFDLIKKNDPDLFMRFYQKAKLLQIAKYTKSKSGNALSSVDVINISFPLNKFTAPQPFTMEKKDAALVLKLTETFEKQLINSLLATAPAIATSSTEDFVDQLQSLPGKAKVRGTAAGIDFDMIMEYPSGASIPMTKGRIKGTRKRKGERQRSMQPTITSAQLTASIQRSLYARMPKGPVKGPPLSEEILTNRTGRFVKSVFTQIRGNLIRYYYNPIYQVHEGTGRAPSETIEGSIRNITQRQVGRQFNILKGF
tara:strand:- start:331 stop:1602 length:1272 start_codon:yes stop_codon:yes gene_type:complete